jgi:hypothetical protein
MRHIEDMPGGSFLAGDCVLRAGKDGGTPAKGGTEEGYGAPLWTVRRQLALHFRFSGEFDLPIP